MDRKRLRVRAGMVATAAGGCALVLGALSASPAIAAKVNATYACTQTAFGQTYSFTMPFTVQASSPTTVAPGTSVKLHNFQLHFTLPASYVSQAEASGVTSISGKFEIFDVSATDAQPTVVNAFPSGARIPTKALPKPPAAVRFAVPSTPITIGTWTAVSKGTMTFTTGSATFKLNEQTASGIVSVPVTCTPHPAVEITQTAVT
jgi:hypothetical protein